MSVVSIYDTRLRIENPYKGNFWTHEESVKNGFWDIFRATMDFLGSIGFYVGEDKEVKKHFPT